MKWRKREGFEGLNSLGLPPVPSRHNSGTIAAMTQARLTEITLYPVKSAGGIAVQERQVEARGLAGDRRWMVVGPDGGFLTQRDWPRMALILTALDADRLRLDAPGCAPLRMPVLPDGGRLTVRVWRSVCAAVSAGAEADAWLSAFLEMPCRLVYMPNETRRTVSPDYAAGEGIVSFADGYPLLLIGEASLDDLNTRLAEPVPMNRFRPNLVVTGFAPYAEDDWKQVRIGDVLFHVVKPCARCAMTTVEQATGEKHGPEPLQTLAGYRRAESGKVLFGQNLIPAAPGMVRVGDSVEVVAR